MKNYKEIAKKTMTERLEILKNRKKLFGGMPLELAALEAILPTFDSLPDSLFTNEPMEGLACDWIERIQK